MGGKSSQSQSTVTIPPEVLARYNAVNQRADEVTNRPYQNYSGQFVAPVNAQQQQGISGVNAAANQAQPYYGAATGQLTQAQNAAQGYNQAATGNIYGAQNVGNAYANQSSQSLQGAGQAAAGLQGQAAQAYGSAYGNAQGYNNTAGAQYAGAQGAAQPLQNQAAQNITNAQNVGGSMTQDAYSTLQGAGQSAQPLQNQAAQAYQGASATGQAGGLAAANLYNQSLNQSQGYNQAAGQNIAGAQAAANPLNQAAVGLAGASTQAVNASPLDTNSINQYMSPYLQNVVGSQAQLLNQGNQQAMAGQLGNAVRSGAFGGDRAGIAAANLNQQQQLANASIYSNLLNQGYNTALQTAQQQQGVNLGAGQANRAALLSGSQQIGALGQQQFGQGMSAAQQQAALGQQVYGQNAGAGQNFAALGQQQFGQGLASGQAQAALGQQQYAQGANTAAQQAAMGQQLYGQGMGAAQQQAALGQQQFGQANTTGQNMAALGQQQFGQGLAAGQAQQSLGQQQYAQGANTAAQQAALGQQQFGQGMTASQQQAAIGQQVYGQGANTSASLANLGLGAQNAALQGAQAQIGAGTLQQQTQQAQNQAEYNQFLQAQSLPYQQLAQQAAIAQGTGALSGSSTYGIAPGGFFSDERLKQDIEPVGKTFDGQTVYKYRYKGDPKDKTQIGLIAQDVEHKHPSAVGLAGGYKTVNYDKATNAAADRGHFYAGGLVPESMGGHVDASHFDEGYAYGGVPDGSTPVAPGLTGADMAALIQAQSAMYAPGHGGLYGSAPGGAPYGGTQIVPAQTGASPRMMEPGELPKYRSPAEHAKDFAEAAKGFKDVAESKSGQWAINKAKNLFDRKEKIVDEQDLIDEAAKKNAPKAYNGSIEHYADGGLASADEDLTKKTSLDVPIPSAENKLAPPELPGEGKSGLSDIADIAKIAAMFMAAANGGRINQHRFHKNDGGSLPYSNMPDGSLSIPTPQDSASGNKLAAPSLPGAGPTGLQNTANLAQTAAGATLAGQGISSALAPAAVGAAGAGTAGAGAGAAAAGAGAAGAGAAGTGMMAALGPVGIGALGVMALSQLFKSKGGQVGYASGGLAGREHHADADPTGAVGRADDDASSTEDGSFSNWYKKQNEDFAGSPVGKVVRGGINLAKDHAYPSTLNLLTRAIPLTAYDAAAGVVNAAGKLGSASGGYQLPIYNPLNPDEPLNSSANVWHRPTAGVAPPAAQFRVTPSSAQAPAAAAQNPFAKNPLAPATQKPPVTAAQKPRVAAPAPAKSGVTITPQDQQLAMNLPADAPAPAGGVAPPVQGALTPGSESNVSMQNYLNSMPVEVGAKPPAGGLAPPAAPPATSPAMKPAAGKPSMIDKLKSSLLQNEKGEYDSSKIIPLLTGIAAMGTAPTRSLGTALATGVGAGAQAYLPTKQRQAQLEQTRAMTATGLSNTATETDYVILANGNRMLKGQYRALLANGKAPALLGQQNLAGVGGLPATGAQGQTTDEALSALKPGAVTSNYVGNAGNAIAEKDFNRLLSMEPDRWENERAISTKTEAGITQNAISAQNQGQTLAQLSNVLMKLPKDGMLSGGALSPIKSSIVARANDVIRSIAPILNIDPDKYVIGDVNSNDPRALMVAAEKLNSVLQFAKTSNADQNSLGALEAALKTVPTTNLSKPEAIQVLASLYVDKQHALDQAAYLNEYKANVAAMHPGLGDLYLSQNALAGYRDDHSALEYGKAKEAIRQLLEYAPEAFNGKFNRAQINAFGKKNGVNDLARFLENR
jgi:hypothetical protein